MVPQPPAIAPMELPASVSHFVGRGAEIRSLDGVLSDAVDGRGPYLAVVTGTAGVGKTALVVQWARRVADRFKDGCVYLDLHGFGPDSPMTVAEALDALLFRIAGAGAGGTVADRTARYRSLVSGRRMLIVLDNAAESEQLLPLLPGTPGSFVAVTSRRDLVGLRVAHDAHSLELEALPPSAALELIEALAGTRVGAEPRATAALADRCGRLPLALRVAAELLASRPQDTVDAFVADLISCDVLDQLVVPDLPSLAVRSVLSWSFRHLSDELTSTFSMLGAAPWRDFDISAAAALLGRQADDGRRLLTALSRAHLVETLPGFRFRLHDLLRDLALEKQARHGSRRALEAGVTRLFDYYLRETRRHVEAFRADAQAALPRPESAAGSPGAALAVSAADEWLSAELMNLTVAVSARASRPEAAVDLALALYPYLATTGQHTAALTTSTAALEAARMVGDTAAEAVLHAHLGTVNRTLSSYADAHRHYEAARTLYEGMGNGREAARMSNSLGLIARREGQHEQARLYHSRARDTFVRLGDRGAEAAALGNLAILYDVCGNFTAAQETYELVLAIYRELDDPLGIARTLSNLGIVAARLGEYDRARHVQTEALGIFRRLKDRVGEGNALENLGVALWRAGNGEGSYAVLLDAVSVRRQISDRAGEARALNDLGIAARMSGRPDEALGFHRRALAVGRQVGEVAIEISAQNGIAEVLAATGNAEEVSGGHREALRLARRIGDRDQEARALRGLAMSALASGRRGDALEQLRSALDIYRELGVPEAASIDHVLTELSN